MQRRANSLSFFIASTISILWSVSIKNHSIEKGVENFFDTPDPLYAYHHTEDFFFSNLLVKKRNARDTISPEKNMRTLAFRTDCTNLTNRKFPLHQSP